MATTSSWASWAWWRASEETAMKDVVFVIVAVAFFLVSWAYVRACERL